MRLHYQYQELERMDKRYTFFMSAAAVAGVIGTAALIGGGVAGGISMYNSGQNVAKKRQQSLVDAQAKDMAALKSAQPSPVKAEKSAREAVEEKRRIRALSGGNTLLTQETLGSSSQTQPKSLLGS